MKHKFIPTYYYPGKHSIQTEVRHEVKEQVVNINVEVSNKIINHPPHQNNKLQLLIELKESMSKADISYKDLNNTVLYDGNIDSPVMVIGEAPGEQEVLQGKPFVGKSGKLLQEMLDHAGICRHNIYVTNVVVWRPPNNKTPMPDEIETMKPYLLEHIKIIQPRIIVLVGGVAYRGTMQEVIAISKVRGMWKSRDFCENIINIFHPSYLLRSPIHRRETWSDILRIRQKILDIGCEEFLTKGSLNLD